MPRAYRAEFRARAVALVRAGKEQKQIAVDLGIHPVTLSKWVKQDRIDRGETPGTRAASPSNCVPLGNGFGSWRPRPSC